ncbi:MAG: serine hydrolase [Odoribacteraceae bacterium]|jgi:beta-glucosidase-like glycosyl hydrolase/CubicO group peptidase (beta-lactamase class C family)|nr:serine hydrolase [Odoribacteraceae bacterium]
MYKFLIPLFLPVTLLAQSRWADSTLNSLSLERQIGQLFMLAAYSNGDVAGEKAIEKAIRDHHVGGIIFFQGEPRRQAILTNRYQQASAIPLMIGMDAENGVGWRLSGVIEFPAQAILGALRDDAIAYRVGESIGRQCRLLGIHVNFAPVADVNANSANPVIGKRSFGEDYRNVSRKAVALARGLAAAGIIAVAKHFPGHGAADRDSHLELPRVNLPLSRLDSVDLTPFERLIRDGIPGVMVAHVDIPARDTSRLPASLSRQIVTNLLREQLHFDGLCFTDAMNMKGVAGGRKPGEADILALLAGNDVILFPGDIEASSRAIKQAVKQGRISRDLIRERCRRVLAAKEKYVIHRAGTIDTSRILPRLNAPADTALKQEIQEKAITLLKNDHLLLPLARLDTLRVAALVFGNQPANAFAATLEKYAPVARFNLPAGATGKEINATLARLEPYNLVILYNNAARDLPGDNFGNNGKLARVIEHLRGKRLVLCHPATPYGLAPYIPLPVDAFLVSYSRDPGAQELLAQAIFGGTSIEGLLPVSVAETFPAGAGLTTGKTRLGYHHPERHGLNPVGLRGIDSLCRAAIRAGATPGCQVLVARDGFVIYDKAFGHHDQEKSAPNSASDIYDVASLTKIVATTPAIMMLHDRYKIALDLPVATYLPLTIGTDKATITIRELLLHTSGLRPSLPFLSRAVDLAALRGPLLSARRSRDNSRKLRDNLYINPRFRYRDSTLAFEQREGYRQVSPGFFAHERYLDSIPLLVLHSPLSGNKRYAYSDLGFIFLQRVIENVSGEPLDQWTRQHLFLPLGARDIGFLPRRDLDVTRVVPSSIDRVFRRTLLHGDVHDPLAALLGGVAGNAGVFSSAGELAKIMTLYLFRGQYGGQQFISPATVDLFTSAQLPPEQSRRGLGFDKPETLPGKEGPTCRAAPPSCYGHAGFTGGCAWNDPENRLTYIFLSNRTYPNEFNDKLNKENTRVKIQEIIYSSLRSSPDYPR